MDEKEILNVSEEIIKKIMEYNEEEQNIIVRKIILHIREVRYINFYEAYEKKTRLEKSLNEFNNIVT